MSKPKLAVFKFTSCDGCQLSLLDCEDELLAVAGSVQIAKFLEATRSELPPPYDVTLVEGSISTPEEIEKIKEIREQSSFLIAIGACATAGGIQALRNGRDVKEFASVVYAKPAYIDSLQTSLPISEYVDLDFELRGCPINKKQLLEVILAFLNRRKPTIPDQSVCIECKLRETSCVMVTQKIACLGPVTHAGCNAICPAYNRGCYGCFGPKENANTDSLIATWRNLGVSDEQTTRAFQTFHVYSEQFQKAVTRLKKDG